FRTWIVSQAFNVISVTPSSKGLISTTPSKSQYPGIVYMVVSALGRSRDHQALVLSIPSRCNRCACAKCLISGVCGSAVRSNSPMAEEYHSDGSLFSAETSENRETQIGRA